MLLLFGLALILNVSSSSAASVNLTNISNSATSLDNVNISSSNYTATNAKSTSNTNSKNVTANSKNPINSTMAAGAPVLVNGLTVAQLKEGVSRVQAFSDKNGRLPNYVSFGTRQISIATFKQNIATQSLTINTIKVNGLTVAQLKEGVSRVQAFYAKNGRLPNYVSFGTRQISIATFQKNIATQGLTVNTKIKTTSSNALSSNASLAQIMKSASKFRYSGAAHTGVAMERIGSGDCWAMSDYLYTHMKAAGMTARIIQYATAYSQNHRSVQYIQNNTWVNAPYRTYFSTNMFNNTQSSGTVIKSNA